MDKLDKILVGCLVALAGSAVLFAITGVVAIIISVVRG